MIQFGWFPSQRGLGGAALCTLAALSIATSTSADDELTNSHDWDVIIFTQHWPATVCYQWTSKNPSHSCSFPSQKNAWTVHGIWPTKLGSEGPNFCNNSWKFDPDLIRPIQTPLEQFWINVEKDTPPYSFWGHEWSKHGTCAAILSSLNNETKYFAQGLRWLQLYTMSDILTKTDIIPNEIKTFDPQSVYNSIKLAIGKNPSLHCLVDPHTGNSYMFEVRICFDKNLELVDCDGVRSLENELSLKNKLIHCDLSKPLVYPSVVPKVRQGFMSKLPLIEIYKLLTWLSWFTF